MQTFEKYQRARSQFTQEIAELAKYRQNTEAIISAGGLLILRSLMLDLVPAVAQTACIAVGRLAADSHDTATELIDLEILPQLVHALSSSNPATAKCAAYALRSLTKHSEAHAAKVLEAGVAEALATALDGKDTEVREAACWVSAYLAKHSRAQAKDVADRVGIRRLFDCLKEPELPLRRIAVNALTQLGQHGEELTRIILRDQSVLPAICSQVATPDPLLKKQLFGLLETFVSSKKDTTARICEHLGADLIFFSLKDADDGVKVAAARLLRSMAYSSLEAAQALCNAHRAQLLVEFLQANPDGLKPDAVEVLSAFAAHPSLAGIITEYNAIETIGQLAAKSRNLNLRKESARCLGALAQHNADVSRQLTTSPAFWELVAATHGKEIGNEIAAGLASGLANSNDLHGLKRLLDEDGLPPTLLIAACRRISVLTSSNATVKKAFAQIQGLKRVYELQHLNPVQDQTVTAALENISRTYPPELVRLYDPNFPQKQIQQLDSM